jgi:hypothetical protein
MLPNGPGPCEHRGAAFGYHGEATLLAWDPAILTDLPEHIAAAFEVRLNRIPLHVRKVLELRSGEASLSIEETITSEAAHTIEFLWGQHPTFGPPLAEPGSRLILPRCEVVAGDVANADARITSAQRADWPLVRGRDGVMIDLSILPPREVHSHDFVRLENLEAGRYTIYNPARDLAFTLHYDARLFPVLGFWQLYCGGPDYPWYQRHYLAALEPACDLPSLSAAAARGTAFRIEPGQCVHAKFDAVLSTGEPAL